MKITFNKLLMGLSIGIVVALMPSALFHEIVSLFKESIPFSSEILFITSTTQKLMGIIVGLCIAMQFKYTPIQASSLAMAVFVGSGAVKVKDKLLILAGSGDVVNMFVCACIAVFLLHCMKDHFKSYAIILIPALVVVITGVIGLQLLPYTLQISYFVSGIVKNATQLQPLLMCIIISVLFSVIIVSPLSSVGVALLASLSGIASGSANLGCAAAGIALAVCAHLSNPISVALAHIVGSPKLQLSNFLKKPVILFPVVMVAAVNGVSAYLFNIQGTALSAGFGVSGLVGPLNALSFKGYDFMNVFIIIVIYFVLPFVVSQLAMRICIKCRWIHPHDYKVNY